MPTVAASVAQLTELLAGAAHLAGDRLAIDDAAAFRDRVIRDIAWTAAFSEDAETVDVARWLVWEASQELGARSASIQDLYTARARGEVHGFTVPAINIRAQTFDMARTVFETAAASDVGAVILELARSEQTYTFQRPADYVTSVLAGAIAAGWEAPVFVQGDHYQFNAAKYAADPEKMTEEIRGACRQAIEVGYRNIDIDSSTLVDLGQPTRRPRAAGELPSRGGADRAHPRARARRADDQRRRRDRRGRQAELDRGRAAGLSRRLSTRARRAPPGGDRDQQGQRPDRHEPRRRPAPGRLASPRSSSTSTSSAGSARSPGATAWRAASSTGRAPCPTSCSTTSRRSRRPRSISRPGSRTCSSSTRPSRSRSIARSTTGASPTRSTNASTTRPTSNSSTRAGRSRSVRSSASSGTSRRRTRSWPPSGARSAFLFSELQVGGTREMVDRYIAPVEAHRPMPEALRAVAAS